MIFQVSSLYELGFPSPLQAEVAHAIFKVHQDINRFMYILGDNSGLHYLDTVAGSSIISVSLFSC